MIREEYCNQFKQLLDQHEVDFMTQKLFFSYFNDNAWDFESLQFAISLSSLDVTEVTISRIITIPKQAYFENRRGIIKKLDFEIQ